MIAENYVSFETAKLLKEEGFDEPCEHYYAISTSLGKEYVGILYTDEPLHNSEINEDNKMLMGWVCTAPTLQMAMKWLREVHNFYIDPYPEDNNTWCLIIWELYPECVKQCKGKYDDYSYSIYEEACEAAIKYCLENLI